MPKSTLPASLIREAVEARLGPVGDFEPLPEGLVSQVFAFRRGDEALVVRVGARAAYEKDAFVARAFGRPGLPVPEVLEIDDLGGGLALCVSRRAPGRRIHDLDLAAAARLTPAIVAMLGEIGRTAPTGIAGCGRFDDAGRARSPTWRDDLLRPGDDAAAWTARLPAEDAAVIHRALARVAQLAPDDEPERRLIHGDFGSANLIADGTRITAVIDWDLAAVGDALYDVAGLLFWNEARLAPVCEALGRRHADERRTLLCYQLRLGVEEVRQAVTGGVTFDLDWLLARLRALVDEAEI
jgi:hygromycin-B 4-O-kinase